jgi:hypothetical protein
MTDQVNKKQERAPDRSDRSPLTPKVLEEIVEQWKKDSFLNTELGHYTALYVLVLKAADDLKQRLIRAL